MRIAEDAATDAEDHRAVPPYESLEGRRVAMVDEGFQQLTIRHAGAVNPKNDAAKVMGKGFGLVGRHIASSLLGLMPSPPIIPR
ncbi:MAG: hypothetical protein ACRELG_18290 [Gemmataceae bacterium]